jgi:hypothetical protein
LPGITFSQKMFNRRTFAKQASCQNTPRQEPLRQDALSAPDFHILSAAGYENERKNHMKNPSLCKLLHAIGFKKRD